MSREPAIDGALAMPARLTSLALVILATRLASCQIVAGIDERALGAIDAPGPMPPPSAVGTGDAAPAPELGDLGTGRDGDLDVRGDVVVNAYAAVAQNVPAGAGTVMVDVATPFRPDDLVLVWQATGLSSARSGDSTAVDLRPHDVGRYELARVRSVAGQALTVDPPLTFAYAAPYSQVIRVPEYADVTIAPGARIRPEPWDGRHGGIVALLAMGVVRNEGAIAADGAGFRGGASDMGTGPELSGCTGNDGTGAGFAAKGEGPYLAGYSNDVDGGTPSGMGNFASGAGGGNCHNAGGGGGGHFGAGGRGGRSWDGDEPSGARLVGGMGGAALAYDPRERLMMGGGGGAGEADDTRGASGGAGGGVVLIKTRQLTGGGAISATGAAGESIPDEGAGGGGAGGLVVLDVREVGDCPALRAAGGPGGSTDDQVGPGGGGGGGGVVLGGAVSSCPTTDVGGAPSGVQPDSTAVDGKAYGAQPGAAGRIHVGGS